MGKMQKPQKLSSDFTVCSFIVYLSNLFFEKIKIYIEALFASSSTPHKTSSCPRRPRQALPQ